MSFGDSKGSNARENALSYFRLLTSRRYIVLAIVLVAAGTLVLRMFYDVGFSDRELPSPSLPLGDQVTTEPKPPADLLAVEDPRWPGRRLPPLYHQWHQRDLSLPQNHWHAASHESEPGFFFVPGHTRGAPRRFFLASFHLKSLRRASLHIYAGSGWGNAFQEILLNAHLAYRLNRACVPFSAPQCCAGTHTILPLSGPCSTTILGTATGRSTPITTGSLFLHRSHSRHSFEVCDYFLALSTTHTPPGSSSRCDVSSCGRARKSPYRAHGLPFHTAEKTPCDEISVAYSHFLCHVLTRFAGPIVGDVFPAGLHSPPAVPEAYFETICEGHKLSINRSEVHRHFRSWMLHDVTDGWVEYMANVDTRCVEVDRNTGPVFDWV